MDNTPHIVVGTPGRIHDIYVENILMLLNLKS